MILFYPRNINLWRGLFVFSSLDEQHKKFHDRKELIEFLKLHGVRLDDPEYPLEFRDYGREHHAFGHGVPIVHQWTVLGWVKE